MRLFLTWAMLMGLTFAAGLVNAGLETGRYGALLVLALGLATIAKARLILARYLRLETAPSWLSGFTVPIVAVVAIVGLSVIAVREPFLRPVGAPHAAPAVVPQR